MIEIAAAVCMIAESDRCKDVTLVFEAQAITPYACAYNGQLELAKWSEANPAWRVAKFTCREAGKFAKL